MKKVTVLLSTDPTAYEVKKLNEAIEENLTVLNDCQKRLKLAEAELDN